MQQIVPTGEFGESGYLYERDFNSEPLTVNVGDGDIALGWSWLADIDAGRRGAGSESALLGGLTLQNNTNMTQTVSLLTSVPLSTFYNPSSLIGGSASGTLTTDGDGGTMSNVNGSEPMYRALIDGAFVGGIADLFPFDSSISVVGFGSNSTGFQDFGQPIPSGNGPAANSSIGILLQFDITPGDIVGWTSNFVIDEIPTPGAAMLLAMAGLVSSHRRRR